MIYPFAKTNSPQMKRIISGTAAVFLCATMFTGCFKKGGDDATQPSSGPNLVDTTPTESIASEPSTEATETTPPTTEAPKVNVAVVKEQVNALSSPTVDSNVLTTLNAGDEVSVNRVETIGAIQWASDDDQTTVMDGLQPRKYSDETAQVIDDEVLRLVENAHTEAWTIISQST